MPRPFFLLSVFVGVIASIAVLFAGSRAAGRELRQMPPVSSIHTSALAAGAPATGALPTATGKCRNAAREIDVAGQKRAYRMHVPPVVEASSPLPLVIALHGYKGTAEGLEAYSGLSAVSDRAGFVIAYPQAQGEMAAWNLGLGANADVDFIDAVISEVMADCQTDPGRVYVVGHSRGGGMAHRMACEDAHRIAAIAAVAGAFFKHLDCSPARPVPVLAIHGLSDPVVPYDGRPDSPSNLHATPRLRDWAAAWAARNGCSPTPESALSIGGEWRETWVECQAEVMLRALYKTGHEWPASPVNAAQAVWDFFERH